ncbi:MAG: DUF554 domain-containing protein [Clostridia bacterium]|nr:DUF554 domain-containing protein [Clostridia bacterium]
MRGLGTVVNVLAIIIGTLIGMLFKRGMKERFQAIMMQACGLATMFIGLSGALEMILSVSEDGGLKAGSTMLIVISLILGGLLGELINIEKLLDSFGEKLKGAVKAKGDNKFVEGFVTSSLVVCVGAMAICGPLEEGLTGNSQTLFIKAILDLVIIIVFASVYGIGAGFSAIPLGLYQGLITVFAAFISPYLSDALITNLSGVGSVLIFAVGLNLIFPKKIRVGNLLPALIVPVLYEAIKLLPWF